MNRSKNTLGANLVCLFFELIFLCMWWFVTEYCIGNRLGGIWVEVLRYAAMVTVLIIAILPNLRFKPYTYLLIGACIGFIGSLPTDLFDLITVLVCATTSSTCLVMVVRLHVEQNGEMLYIISPAMYFCLRRRTPMTFSEDGA